MGTLVGGIPTAVSSAAATNAESTRIDSPTTITEPGTYLLESNVDSSEDGPCIDIQSSDVTLDGRGYELVGTTTGESIGVRIGSDDGQLSNVGVRNLVVSNWNDGVRLQNVADCRLTDTYLSLCESAVVLRNSAATIESNFVEDSDGGILLRDRSRGRLVDNTVKSSRNSAIGLFDSTAEIRGNLLAEGRQSGIALSASDDCTVVENVARGNRTGLSLTQASSNNDVSANSFVHNESRGVSLEGQSGPDDDSTSGNRVSNNEITDNGGDGVFLGGVRESEFVENTIRDNGANGVELVDSGANRFVRNVVCDNAGEQLVVGGDSNVFRNNVTDCREELVCEVPVDDELAA
ncbi:nitrous oxide reductase family maturation protein NosD [Haloferax namakaokahaiae]|uniref:Nitrous oxide reductase family maturation protein NosD n=1 Tax=Haloferax namakaokahaiae TaxID=1748331 RepID=A0ABD5ZFK2_9EURY